MIDIDPFLADAVSRDTIDVGAKPTDHFETGGGLQWQNCPFRLRSGHDVDFNGATLELNPDRVTDEMLRSEQPIIMIPSQINHIYGKTGEDAWAAVSTHQAVRNLHLIGNFSKLKLRADALGVSLRITAIGLQGHDAQQRGIILSDFGAYRANPNRGAEAFPVWISGSDSGYDKNALYTVDPKHVFDENTPASGLEYQFTDYAPEASNDQVTVGIVTGAMCSGVINLSPWAEQGPWRQIMRRDAWLKYDVTASGKNLVQGGTIYQSLKGTVDGRTRGALVGYYSDFLRSKGVRILSTCSFKGGTWGVVVRLSPTAADNTEWPKEFSAEDFVIEYFDTDAAAGAVYLNADLMPLAVQPAGRFIRNMAIDERLRSRVVNDGNRAQVIWIPAPDTKKKGCRFF